MAGAAGTAEFTPREAADADGDDALRAGAPDQDKGAQEADPVPEAAAAAEKLPEVPVPAEVNCRCNPARVCAMRVSRTAKNPGRAFFCCPLSSIGCKYFAWAELGHGHLNQQLPPAGVAPAGGGVAAPTAAPSAGPGDTCYKCGASGHWARDCTSETGSSARPLRRGAARVPAEEGTLLGQVDNSGADRASEKGGDRASGGELIAAGRRFASHLIHAALRSIHCVAHPQPRSAVYYTVQPVFFGLLWSLCFPPEVVNRSFSTITTPCQCQCCPTWDALGKSE